jgi:hypothetical protein
MAEEILLSPCQAKPWCEKNAWWWLDDLCDHWEIKQGSLEEKRRITIRITGDRYDCLVNHKKRRKEAGIPVKLWYPLD